MLSVIIPASNEAALITQCIQSVIASDLPQNLEREIVVVANGCRDDTARRAEAMRKEVNAREFGLQVLDLKEGSKPGALNAGDTVARGHMRVYLDADITMDPSLLGEIVKILDSDRPAYASGKVVVMRPRSNVSKAYAQFWQMLPFMQDPVPGCGLFAVNAAGRKRWGEFPRIISDDTYVRMQFTPDERKAAPSRFYWPISEGFANLVKVRRRQDRGVREIAELYPQIVGNEQKKPMGISGLLSRIARHPVGFAAYAAVALATKLPARNTGWTRGR